MARRTKKEAEATRDLILDAAERTFFANGVSHTSLADIAAAAGLTRGAIYWHFKNKCDLFSAMMDRELLPLGELLDTTFDAREPDPLRLLRDIIVDCLRDIARNARRRTIVEIAFLKWEHTHDMQPVIDRKQINVSRSIASMQRGFDNAVAKGQLPAVLDTQRAARFLHALIVGVMLDYLTASDRFDILAEAPRLVDGYIDMLRTSAEMRNPPRSDDHPSPIH